MTTIDAIRCPSCGVLNRVSAEQVQRGHSPVCGRCKSPLAAPQSPLVVTDETFASQIQQSALPVVVDMWAPWCGPCRLIGPIIDQLAKELSGHIRFAKLNVDENPRTASRYQIVSIPALVIFKDGKEIDRLVGAHPKAAIIQRLEQLLARSG
jgi:thioredoxin 2